MKLPDGELKDLPATEAADMTNYLLIRMSLCSRNPMKAYKSMEAYSIFVGGWVQDAVRGIYCPVD